MQEQQLVEDLAAQAVAAMVRVVINVTERLARIVEAAVVAVETPKVAAVQVVQELLSSLM
jgi:hypothetical protein